MDKEIFRELWQGKLPLCFKLHTDDVDGIHTPDPYYMMVPRVSYFPLVLDKVVKYYNRFISQSKQQSDVNDTWLDYEGQPIKWHHPIGLSWDLFGSSYELPWTLVLHFSEFPSNDLLRCNTKASIKTNFISMLKEADVLKHKRSVMKNMVKKDQNQLWSGLVDDRYETFWSVNKRLMERCDNELFRHIPFRMYFSDYSYIQKLIKPCTKRSHLFETNNETQESTLADMQTFKCSHMQSLSENPEECSQHRSTTMLDLIEACFEDKLDLLGEQTDKFRYKFITHGIEIPLNTPLQWLSEHLSYPDNFLHICAVLKN